MCVCENDALYDPAEDACVPPQECDKYQYALDGDFLQCLNATACADRDGYTFVYRGVRTCADACPAWWYRAEDSFCRDETWRKSTAIAVPVAVLLAAAVVLVVIIVVRRKKTAPEGEKEAQMRDQVAHA